MSQAGLLHVTDSVLPPDVPLIFETNSGNAVASANVIEILGGAGATTSASGNVITVTVSGASFTWNVVTSAMNPITLSPENGYIAKGLGQVVFVLPASAQVGDSYRIVSFGNLWTITENANQTITIGMLSTTAGSGSVTATSIGDAIEIVNVTQNLQWFTVSVQGNLTII